MTNKKRVAFLVINDDDANDANAYIDIIKKHRRKLGKRISLKGTFGSPIIMGDDDEEVRTIIAEEFGTLGAFIGEVENKRKVSKKLRNPKAIKSYFQQQRDNLLRDGSEFSEFAAFIMDYLDAELFQQTKQGLFPVPDYMTDEKHALKLNILKAMKNEVLGNKRVPSSLDAREVVEIVLKKHKNLANEDVLIKLAEEVLHIR